MTDLEPQYLTQLAAARYLSVSRWTLKAWTDAGRITPRELPGGLRRYAVADLDALAAERTGE
jgi:excisionase family DNA binding protein